MVNIGSLIAQAGLDVGRMTGEVEVAAALEMHHGLGKVRSLAVDQSSGLAGEEDKPRWSS